MSFFTFSALLPVKQLFCHQLSLPKICVCFHSSEFLSPKVLDLDGGFSSENPYHDKGDSCVDGPSVSGPLAVAYSLLSMTKVQLHRGPKRDRSAAN